jgi:hypothetical protein
MATEKIPRKKLERLFGCILSGKLNWRSRRCRHGDHNPWKAGDEISLEGYHNVPAMSSLSAFYKFQKALEHAALIREANSRTCIVAHFSLRFLKMTRADDTAELIKRATRQAPGQQRCMKTEWR